MLATPIFHRQMTKSPRTPLHVLFPRDNVVDDALTACRRVDEPPCASCTNESVRNPHDQPIHLLQLPTEVIVHILTSGGLTAADWACVQATCAPLRHIMLNQHITCTITIDARAVFTRRHAIPALVTPVGALTPTQRAISLCRWLTSHQSAIRHLTIANHDGDGDHGPDDEAMFGGSPSFASYLYGQAPRSSGPRHDPLTQPLVAALGPLTSLALHNSPCSTSMATVLGTALGPTLTELRISCDRSYKGRRVSLRTLAPLLGACGSVTRFEWTGVRMAWLGSTLAPQQHVRATVLHCGLPGLTRLAVDDAYMALGGGELPPHLKELRFRFVLRFTNHTRSASL